MLVYFSVSGFYSFGKKEQTVDFRAKPRSRLANTKYEYNFNLSNKYKPMKSAVFFGQNASGKTNLFLAIKTCLSIIKKGLKATIEESEDFFQNALNKKCNSISFGLGITEGNHLFEFFIKFDKNFVIEEFLKIDGDKIYELKDHEIEFNRKLFFEIPEMSKMITNSLLADDSETILIRLKFLPLLRVDDFFKCTDKIMLQMTSSYSKNYLMNFTESKKQFFEENKEIILDVLSLIDASITDFKFHESLKDQEQRYDILIQRNEMFFRFQIESEGVKKIIQLMISIVDLIKHNKILIIDELDSSISTYALIRLFNELINTQENSSGQLIVSSHNIMLFDISFLNSQQIFITSKDIDFCTQIKSFYEFDVRSEKKNAYLDYLKGFYNE
ncbi:hypothetical protein BKH42_03575 [Helicobacter sp. 13S00482-2]|uniref:AAA family ATPase n=1 Tax=Helicobacter sp. 13S00482-2 TaxID=1476200 RepID=UPI000BA6871D|nr:AAA family ATPase [Helicobacter sp. 13S00482-2]PAF53821.1 hypothetical protein BKH42_03575 [Helicobacter sp. 13S00482-2]